MKNAQFAKFVIFVNALVPLALLGWDAYQHQLGANPVEFAIRTTGMLTLIFLLVSLCVTPARKISGWNYLSNFRRMLGLYAFFYGLLHFSCYFVLDRSMSIQRTIDDTLSRRFIFFGMAGMLLMVPLAATSTNAMIKRLGAKRWKRLHSLVYFSAIAGVTHFWMLVKADLSQPIAFAVVLAILLGYRIAENRLSFLRRKRSPVAA
jgi:sulfoxide reductase heme-binding subunit YedZ